jgi:hypothetical protein
MKIDVNQARSKRRVAVQAAMFFVIVLLVTQMWLLTATLESYLAGHTDIALPGMLVSAGLFVGCLVIYRFVTRLDRRPSESQEEPRGAGPWNIG